MFGYLRLMRSSTPFEVQARFRGCYCTLCHALWKNYGFLTRFTLSYDMTALAAIMGLDALADTGSRLLCYKSPKGIAGDEAWKRMAALSVIMTAEKLKDNILDENSLSARLLSRVLRRSISKATADYPEAARIAAEGFKDMTRLEEQGADVTALSQRFESIMTDTAGALFDIDGPIKAVIAHAAGWIYFADALDDLEEDVRKGRFNPLKALGSTRRQLVEEHGELLERFIRAQVTATAPRLNALAEDAPGLPVIMCLLTETLPEVTYRVLTGEGRRGAGRLARLTEKKGGYRLV